MKPLKGLWEIIDGTEVLEVSPTAQQVLEIKKRSQKAFSTIMTSVSASQ